MGGASKALSVCLRIAELIGSVIVLGVVGNFLRIVGDAGASADSRLVYVVVVASLGTFFSIILLPPFTYSFLAFPIDLILSVLWLVAFCLLESVRCLPSP